jgi:glycosyltransferase involved in cell wall biosynthesis
VLFVSGPGGDSIRYRCRHQREQLELAGISADIGRYGELDLAALIDSYGAFVLYRLPWSRVVGDFVSRARRRGRAVVADVDDLVFDASRMNEIQAATRLGKREQRGYERAIAGLRRTLGAVDGVVVSTDPLANEAKVVNAAAVAYNAVSDEMVEQADAALAGRPPTDDRIVTMAYLSGTATHDLDFLEAADAVLSVLDAVPSSQFVAAGFLSLDERFDRFGERVVRAPYRAWQELPSLLAGVDVSLAPLESGNSFAACKSCVKYLEAGLLAVPTVASATSDFNRVIDHGQNGLLASASRDWHESLLALVESPELRARLGTAARGDVVREHTTAARASRTLEAFRSLSRAFGEVPP